MPRPGRVLFDSSHLGTYNIQGICCGRRLIPAKQHILQPVHHSRAPVILVRLLWAMMLCGWPVPFIQCVSWAPASIHMSAVDLVVLDCHVVRSVHGCQHITNRVAHHDDLWFLFGVRLGSCGLVLWMLCVQRRSPAVACWASDHWVASSNPLRGKFRH